MQVFALSDLHLSFTVDKPMDIFGSKWENHSEKIETAWQETVGEDDLVLVPGDISWAMRIEDAVPDLEFVDRLNGTKVIIRGNHEYWWDSVTKVRNILPPSIHAIQNDAFSFGNISVGGTRLWDLEAAATTEDGKKIYDREVGRLKLSLERMDADKERIIMVHYPVFDNAYMDTPAKHLLEEYKIKTVVYGHLHGKAQAGGFIGEKDGIDYHLVASDYLDFKPKQIL